MTAVCLSLPGSRAPTRQLRCCDAVTDNRFARLSLVDLPLRRSSSSGIVRSTRGPYSVTPRYHSNSLGRLYSSASAASLAI